MAEADTKPLLPLTQAGSASPCRGLGTNWLFNFPLGRLPGEVQSLPWHTSCGHRPGEQGHLAAWQLTHLSQRQLGVGQSTFQHQRESSGIHGEMSDDRVGCESPYNLPSYRLSLLNIRKKVHATNHGPPRYRAGGGTGPRRGRESRSLQLTCGPEDTSGTPVLCSGSPPGTVPPDRREQLRCRWLTKPKDTDIDCGLGWELGAS